MSLEDVVRQVHAHLKQKCRAPNMTIPPEWIEGCVSWYRSNNPGSVDTQALFDFVTDQWFLADFKQLGLRSLPPNLQRTTVVQLRDCYVLQLLHVLNIGQSAYSQHCKITKGLDANEEVSADKKIPAKWEPKGRRTLLLSLTDGTQDVQALEYVPITQLHLDLIPGLKVLVKGPAECRRGIILLRPNNIELLGGDVSDLVNCNAPENVLARLIGKAENPNPVYGDYSSRIAATNEHEDEDEYSQYTQNTQASAAPASGRKTQHIERMPAELTRPNLAGSPPPPPPSHRSRCTSSSSALAVAREKRNLSSPAHPPPPKKAPPQRPPSAGAADDMFPDDDDDILFLTDMPDVRTSAPTPLPERLPAIRSLERPFDYLSGHLERRKKSAVPPHRVPSLQYIVIKGFLSTIRSKLEVVDNKWRLSASVNDGSAALDVDISSEILESMIGYSPRELKSMMTRDGSSRHAGQKALDNAKQSLIRLNCLLHIRWPDVAQTCDGKPLPELVQIEDITRRHLDMLLL